MRIEYVAAIATSTVTSPAQPPDAVPGPAKSTGDVFAQLLAALGQPSTDTNVSALLSVVDPTHATAPQDKPADHPANDPPGQTLQNLLAQLHAADGKPDNPGEVVSDAAKLFLTKTSTGTPPDGTPSPDLDKAVPDRDPISAVDANTLLAQLLAGVQPPPSAPTPPQAPSGDVKPPAATPTDSLPAIPADAIASAIGRSGTQAKPARDTKRDETTGKSESVKSQSPSSGANAHAALSTAADHTFSDNPPAATSAHSDAGGSNSNGQPDNPRPHPAAPVGEVRAAPQATLATGSQPANPPPAPPPNDSNAPAAANGTAQSPQPANVLPAQFHAKLQVGPAPAHAVPDIGALAVTIAAKSQDGIKHFDIRLDPPELGKIEVRLTMDDTGKAQASLAVEKPQTLELLQKDSSTLERALKDAGLDLSQNGLNFSLRGQQQQAGGENSPSPRGRALHVRAAPAIDQPAPALSSSGAAGEPRLDIRV